MAKLSEQPLCEVCKIKGLIENEDIFSLAEDCHHLRSFTQGRDFNEMSALFYDYDNVVSVCKKCHNSIHHGELKGCESLEEIKDRLKFIKEEREDLKKHIYKPKLFI